MIGAREDILTYDRFVLMTFSNLLILWGDCHEAVAHTFRSMAGRPSGQDTGRL